MYHHHGVCTPCVSRGRRSVSDPAHGWSNFAKNCLNIVTNSGKMKLKPKRMAAEHAQGRFLDVTKKNLPWVASKPRLALVSEALRNLKVPVDWPANVPLDDTSSMKIAEALAVCGDRGMWSMGQLDLADNYGDLMVSLLRAAGLFLVKCMTPAEVAVAEKALVDALANAEILLPMQFCTSTNHMMLHLCQKVR